jgi:Neuraminidase (sialidase)
MLKKLLVLVLFILIFCPQLGFSQISPISGVTPVMIDSATHDRFIGTYRSGNTISFYEPTTGNLLVTYYALASADPDRRRINAAISSDAGATWTVYKNINSGVGSEMNASYPTAYGTATTPIITYYNSAVPEGQNMNREPIVATDLGGWGGGIWNNVSVDVTGTEDDPVDARYHSFAISPEDANLWLLSGARYAAAGNATCVYRSTDAGVTWSDPIDVASIIQDDSLESNYVYSFTANKQPLAMSFGADNKVYGAFQGQMEDAYNVENALYVVSEDGGVTWSTPAMIPGTESLMFTTADVYRNFSTIIDNDGNWHVFAIGEDTTETAKDGTKDYRIWDFKFDGATWNITKFGYPQFIDDGIAQPGLTNSDEEDVMNSAAIGPDGTLYYAYTDVYDTTDAGGDPHNYKYRIYVMISEDNGTTWLGPQWVYEEDGWASEYPCEMTSAATDKLHFFFRSGGGTYDEYKEMRYLGVPTQAIKDSLTSIPKQANTVIPKTHKLFQNYPNPFNPSTTIRFNLCENAHVKLTVYNLLGQKIATLIDKTMLAGEKGIVWYAEGIPSGTYFYRLDAGKYSEVREMTLIK